MTTEIKDSTPEVKDDGFDGFKTKVVKVSASWIAFSKVCSKFISQLTPPQLREDAENTVPGCICHSVSQLSAHFKDVEVHLLDNDLDMEKSIQIYSSWVQPRLDTTVYWCSELAEEARELLSCKSIN